MILIADSGSTKVDWAYLTSDGSVERFKTTGINPAHLGGERITEILSGEVLPMAPKVDDIYFFGAGIVGEEMKLLLQRCFSAVWPEAKAELYSDVMASGLSLFGKGRGIACIMGTGSNSCLYDDGKILAKVNAGGFILGDEGSGAWIGKQLLMDYVKGIMPADLLREFEAEYELSYPKVVSKVYKEERPAAYLASLNMFAASRMENPYIETLIKRGFNEFIDRNIVMYEGFTAEKVGFIGSVALHYEKWLRECCANRGIEVGTILKAPLDGLIEFYKK